MIETTTLPDPPAANIPPDVPVLVRLIIALLAPMFIAVSGGDIALARAAALSALQSYQAQTDTDLISIAQIAAFGLAALGSLSLSMGENLSLSMTLRLRSNAVACNRAAERNRRALQQAQPEEATPPSSLTEPDMAFDEQQVLADIAATQQRADQATASLQIQPPAAPQPPVPVAVSPLPETESSPSTLGDQQHRAVWGGAMTTVAAELTANLAGLSPAQREHAIIQAAALTNCANDMLSGKPIRRPRPGDLSALLRPSPR